MNLGLENKVSIVTAASKGLGRAVVEALLEEGSKVAFCSSNSENLNKTFQEFREKFGGNVFAKICDLNDEDSIEEFYFAVTSQFGAVDILVNNCGGPKAGYFEVMQNSDWESGYKQVLRSAVKFTELVIPGMKKKKWGRIINITSLSVKQPVDNLLLSNVFRSGLTAFAKTLSNNYAAFGITVNNIAPGHILTERLKSLIEFRAKETGRTYEEIFTEMTNVMPVKRFGEPKELAALAAFLASEKATFITGTTIQVDGGMIKSLL